MVAPQGERNISACSQCTHSDGRTSCTELFSQQQRFPSPPQQARSENEPIKAKGLMGQEPANNDARSEDFARTSRSFAARRSIHCNLDRFLEFTCPAVPPQYLPKSCQWEACQRRRQEGDSEPLPYFTLADLWESFDEWSAYGAGVPINLSGKETVVQYYVPYLSAMQLYTRSGKWPYAKLRCPVDESDTSDCDPIDWGSETSSDSECDKTPECWNCDCWKSSRKGLLACCVCETHQKERKVPNSRKCELGEENGWDWRGHLLFEYFEQSPPHARVPLLDKIADLARDFPGVRLLKSVDLLPASWMSVAWYPIYRIPTGPTLQDLGACFLTYHCLSTSLQDGVPSGIVEPSRRPSACSVSVSDDGSLPKIYLEAFGLAHYKFRGSIWTSAGNPERRHASSLFRCAESWLRCLHVRHPDFEFFRAHDPTSR